MKKLIGIFMLLTFSFSAVAKSDLKLTTAFDFYAPIVTDKDSMNQPQHGSIVYDTTDDAFFGLDSEGMWQNLGGASETSNVKTLGATAPKLVSVRISNAGSTDEVSNELGNWIDGDCDDPAGQGQSTCVFESGVFSQIPNCSCSGTDASGDVMNCTFLTLTTSGFTTTVANHNGTAGVDKPIMVMCHGI